MEFGRIVILNIFYYILCLKFETERLLIRLASVFCFRRCTFRLLNEKYRILYFYMHGRIFFITFKYNGLIEDKVRFSLPSSLYLFLIQFVYQDRKFSI